MTTDKDMPELKPWKIEKNSAGFVYVVDHDGNKVCTVFGKDDVKMQRAMAIADIPVLLSRTPSPDKIVIDPPMSEREVLCRALDRMGWHEINAFQEELRKGQSIYEDAGGYFMRAIKRLFGIAPRDEVVTYRQAAAALIAKQESGE